jgi:methylglutaconyl-CoA hydratase
MKKYKYVQLQIEGNRANLALNRPRKHNALNPELIEDLHKALKLVSETEEVQFLVLSGEGKSFCAGADINWFVAASEKAKSDNWQEYLRMAELLKVIHQLPVITIAAAHQNVLGGGNGLLAACDFAVAECSTTFAFGEIKLGIVPATIIPYVAKRVSIQNMKKLMYSGERFWAKEAKVIGLLDFIADDGKLEKVVGELIEGLKSSSPKAIRACKQLLLKTETGEVSVETSEYTAAVLADLVHSDEGKEGLQAFLDKRTPDWQKLKLEQN